MKKILIIGGTRNMGYFLAQRLLQTDHHITLLNRGVTPDDLPGQIARLRCDRTDAAQMRRALAGREFDVVVDMTLFTHSEAETVVELLSGRVGHFIMVSTGQVYLVRGGAQRPYREADYDGPLKDAPPPNTYDYEEWLYGMDKRAVEDVLFQAHADQGFPVTTLRLPMVNSERDGFLRLYSYLLRLQDGGPVLLPDGPSPRLRHIYAGDVVTAILRLIDGDATATSGLSFNISQDETVTIEDFLALLGQTLNLTPELRYVPRDLLEANGLLPDCSPFSDRWMSELDNRRSKDVLGMHYTPLPDYLAAIVAHYRENPPAPPASYRRRRTEKQIGSSESARQPDR